MCTLITGSCILNTILTVAIVTPIAGLLWGYFTSAGARLASKRG